MSAAIRPWDDINAIRDYLDANSVALRSKPAGRKLMTDWERWYADTNSLFGFLLQPNVKLGEAKWYRNEANKILRRKLPKGWVPSDSTQALQSAPPKSNPTPEEGVLTTGTKVALGAGAIGALYLWWRFGRKR